MSNKDYNQFNLQDSTEQEWIYPDEWSAGQGPWEYWQGECQIVQIGQSLHLQTWLALEGVLALRKLRVRNKDEDLQVGKALKFVAGTSNPVFTGRRCQSRCPWRVVIIIDSGVHVAISDSSKDLEKQLRHRVWSDRKGNKKMYVMNQGKIIKKFR